MDRILIVEDDTLTAEAIALALSEEGYAPTIAPDGQTALSLLLPEGRWRPLSDRAPLQSISANFDLLILDLMLPYVNGLDVCQWLRREQCQIPILMLSARGSETDRVVGLEVGADDYLTKPFGMRELVARCRALLRRSHLADQSNAEPTLTFQDITLYLQEYRVVVRGIEVSLTPKEFRLLELFMNSPRRVWSRDQLLEHVWGMDYVGDSKTVDVHIRWLREKLELDPSRPQYIVTVRGFGYRFG